MRPGAKRQRCGRKAAFAEIAGALRRGGEGAGPMLLERKLSLRGRNVGGAGGNSLPRKVASSRFAGDSLRFRKNEGWRFGPKSYLRKNRVGQDAADGSRKVTSPTISIGAGGRSGRTVVSHEGI